MNFNERALAATEVISKRIIQYWNDTNQYNDGVAETTAMTLARFMCASDCDINKIDDVSLYHMYLLVEFLDVQ